MAEWLDVVDASDRVVGAASRAEVHARGLLHRAVHILVINPAGAVYVQQRSLQKDCFPGLWDTSAAGHVDRGEDYLQAAHRELEEELGLVRQTLCSLARLPARSATGNEFARLYLCRTSAEPVPDPAEIMAAGWWTGSALADWINQTPEAFTTVFRQIFAFYRSKSWVL